MSDREPAVIIKNLHKSFKLPHEQHSGIKQRIINIFKGVKGYETQKVLDDVSFEIKKGEFFGIVGRNGSGKSTLLKIIAGIYVPDKGLVQVNGSLTPFIELGVGFNPELTGRENVFLNGALLGFSDIEVDKMYDAIVEFAELDKFMDQKLKNYSSGMQVRLAFSIAIRANSDILLIDEVLAVGDAAFQQKCFDYFYSLKKDKKTIILVTHDMGAVKRFCDRAMMVSKGRVDKIGVPESIAELYTENNIEEVAEIGLKEEFEPELFAKIEKKRYKNSDDLNISVVYNIPNSDKYFINLSLGYDGIIFADKSSKYSDVNDRVNANTKKLGFRQSLKNFNGGKYDICVSLHRKTDNRLIKQELRAASFLIEGYDQSLGGPMKLDGEWGIE